MNESTKRPLVVRRVEEGAMVPAPCEGGVVMERASEPGAMFEVEGQAGIYVPASLLGTVFKLLREPKQGRKR